MSPVTIWLVFRTTAPAQGHAIANFIFVSITGNDLDSSPNPQGPTASLSWIFDYADGLRQMRLDRLSRFLLDGNQAA